MLGVGRDGPIGPRRCSDVRSVGWPSVDPDPAPGDEIVVAPRSAPPQVDSPAGGPAAGVDTAGGPAARDALAVISAVDGIGPATLERLLAIFGGPAAAVAAAAGPDGAALLRATSRDPDTGRPLLSIRAAEALRAAARTPETILGAMRDADVHLLSLDDAAYPTRLRSIELPPRALFIRGSDLALQDASVVAVVGTRRPTDDGRRTATRIAGALARAGALVVSGLALGIDGAAHAAAVAAAGRTTAVIGGGHDRLSPVGHDRLARAIVDGGGAVVSEHPPGITPTRGTFPRRNRIISGLADAVVVVEAGARSGALLTAAWALEQGRECFLVPGSIDAPQSAGCLAWLRDYGGAVRIVAGIPQLLEDLELDGLAAFGGPSTGTERWAIASAGNPGTGAERSAADAGRRSPLVPPDLRPRPPTVEAVALALPEREARLLRALARGASTADELAAATGQPIAAVLAGMTGLEERALVEERFGRYRIEPDLML
jgi:DNA processing protein